MSHTTADWSGKSLALFLAIVMVLSMVAMASVGGAAGTAQISEQQDPDDVKIADELIEEWDNGAVASVIVRLDRIDRSKLPEGDRDGVVNTLQAHADETQEPLLEWAAEEEAIRVANTFWLANAVLLEVRTDEVDIEDLAAQENVYWLHHNVEFELPDHAVVEENVSAQEEDVTYGLDQINAPDVWDELGITGEGAEVAILDTGVNADHPDFEDFDSDNWQEFDDAGEPVDSEPFDDHGHGTHVSGTAVGPIEPDGEDIPAYGVAPDAELWHAKVLDQFGGGTFAQVIAGMEWSVDDTTAHIVGMSLGAGPTDTTTIEATEHIWDAGLILSASNGNWDLSTPGAYFSSFGSQAIDENFDLAAFAVGEWIEPEEFFDDPDEIPDHWPDEYVTPDASAAGVDVLSLWLDDYALASGTSMSQPHKAGTLALMVSGAGGEIDRDFFWETLHETAWQPDQAPDPDPNDEYGHGVIDALNATQQVSLNQSVEGQVNDTDGEPIEGAEVTVEDPGITVETDEDGLYEVLAEAGDNTVTATAFGFQEVSHGVTVPENGTVTQDFELPAALDGMVVMDQPDAIDSGDTIDATLLVAHPDSITVENLGAYDGELTLFIDGEEAEFGEPFALDGQVGEVAIEVGTQDGDSGEVELEYTLEGLGDSLVLTTGPTEVFEELLLVAVIDDTEGHGDDWVAILDDELPGVFEVEHVDSSDALDDIEAFDAYFVHGLTSANEADWFDATDGIGTIYTEQFLGPTTLNQRSDTIDDPDSVTRTTGLSTWTITDMHPILDGVADPGDEVLIHTDTFEDGGSFTDTDADVYAEAEDGDNAFAVDEDRQDVLLTAVGFGWVSPGDHTQDGLDILSNSIQYLTIDVVPEVVQVAVVDEGTVGDAELARLDEEDEELPEITVGEDLFDRLDAQLDDELFELDLISGADAVEAAEAGEYDVYVVNQLGEEHVEDFDAFTEDPLVGVVWLDQWGSSSDGISEKSEVLNNPEETDQSFSSPNPDLEIVEDHPIFDGVGDAGDSFLVHDATFADHTWFDGYDGEILGLIQAGGVTDGHGIGIDEAKGTILLSSFGSSTFVDGDDFTEEADTVLANAVEHLAPDPTVVDPVQLVEEQPEWAAPGDMFGAMFEVDGLEKVKTSLHEDSTASQAELDLYHDGSINDFDQWRFYDDPIVAEDFMVEIESDADAVGSVILETTFAFPDPEAEGDEIGEEDLIEVTIVTGPTAVFDMPLNVPQDVPTIQEAIDLGPDGTTIVIDDGHYAEVLDVYKANQTFEADGTVSIEGAMVTADGITFDGVDVDANSDGYVLDAVTGVTIADANVTGADTGISATDATDITLMNVSVDATDTDVAVTNSSVALEDVAAMGSGDGFDLAEADLTAIDIAIDVGGDGLTVTAMDGFAIDGLEIAAGGSGVVATDSDGLTVTDTNVSAGDAGVALDGIADASVTDTTVSGAEYGILADGATEATITDNELQEVGTGILVDGGSADAVADNAVVNASTGIAVEGSAAVAELTENEVTEASTGLVVAGSFTEAVATLNTIEAETGVLVSGVSNDNVDVSFNDLEMTDTAIVYEGTTPFDARLNWFGDRGPVANNGVEGDVIYDPFLTEMHDEVDPDTTAIAVDVLLEEGETYTIGLPGTTEQTLGDVFADDFEAVVYGYDSGDQEWHQLAGDDELSALSAIMVVDSDEGAAVLDFQIEEPATVPGSEHLNVGWNLVSPTQYTALVDGFGKSNMPDNVHVAATHGAGHLGETVEYLGDEFDGDAEVNPFGGYWVHIESDEYQYGVDLHMNPTTTELYESLDLFAEEPPDEPDDPPVPDEIEVAVVDEQTYHDDEIEVMLEANLPDMYNVDTLEADELLDAMADYDVFVIQRLGSDALAEDFLNALGDEQATVYLDSHQGATSEAYADGVYRLHNVRDDPVERESESLGTDTEPVTVEILVEHPIFDGVGDVGDHVEVVDDGSTWGSWFDGYSGEVLGNADFSPTDPGEFEGPSIAVNEDENEVLNTAIARDFFNDPEDFTDEGEQLLANSVIVAADLAFGTAELAEASSERTQPDMTSGGTVAVTG